MSVNKYKVGDRVVVKSIEEIKSMPGSSPLRIGGMRLPDGGCWDPVMEKFCGMTAKVIADYDMDRDRYDLDITSNHYFSENMLEPFKEPLAEIKFKDLQLFDEDLL